METFDDGDLLACHVGELNRVAEMYAPFMTFHTS